MNPVVGALRQLEIGPIICLDDILIMHQGKDHLIQSPPGVSIPGPDCELDQTTNDYNSENRVSGVSSQLCYPTPGLPNSETEKSPAECQFPLMKEMVSFRDLARSGTWQGLWERQQLQLVDLPEQTGDNGIPTTTMGSKYDNRIQCLQYRLERLAGRNSYRGSLVNERGLESYQLLAAYLTLQCFAKQKHNIAILLKMDNVTAVT